MAAPSTDLRQAMYASTAGFLGWTLDAFDFFLVIVSAPRIAASFHVTNSAVMASVFLTLCFRPVGAFIFGLLADRYGRRIPMMVDLVFYSADPQTGQRSSRKPAHPGRDEIGCPTSHSTRRHPVVGHQPRHPL